MVLHAPVILYSFLVSGIFAINSNQHQLESIYLDLCMSREDLRLGLILLCWLNIFKELVTNRQNQIIKWT